MTIQAGNFKDYRAVLEKDIFVPIRWEWHDIDILVTLSAGNESDPLFEAQIEADTLIALAAAVEKQKNLFLEESKYAK